MNLGLVKGVGNKKEPFRFVLLIFLCLAKGALREWRNGAGERGAEGRNKGLPSAYMIPLCHSLPSSTQFVCEGELVQQSNIHIHAMWINKNISRDKAIQE